MPLWAKIKFRIILQFLLYFFLANILLSLLICTNYIYYLPDFYALTKSYSLTILIWSFLAVSLIGQISLVYLVCFFIVSLIAIICRRSIVISTITILLSSTLLLVLIADSIVFRMYHMHYAALAWQIFKASAFSHVITFSYLEILWIVVIIFALVLIESLIAGMIWHCVHKLKGRWHYKTSLFMIFCLIASYSLNSIARENVYNLTFNAKYNHLFIKATRFIPYYDEIYSAIVPINHPIYRIQTGEDNIVTIKAAQNTQLLNYPKHTMQCKKTHNPLNIVLIVIDAWRYDAMSASVTPNIYQFALQSLQFQNHWSGGNCTQAGIFSLFYGLPAYYWDAVYEQRKRPELMQQLLNNNYRMGIFASAKLNFPAFDKTIFSNINSVSIETPGKNTLERDQKITQRFKKFLASSLPDQPFFSFIFYDSVHNYCESTKPVQHFQPAINVCNRFGLTKKSDPTQYFNRYLNAVYFVDNEIKQVLNTLKQKQLLKNTIVIITSDHGEEINDNHSGYWQHASAYTSYQLHTPFLIYWPEHNPKVFKHFTTHYDLVPTLMTNVIQCNNPTADYTIGQSLFNKKKSAQILISYGYADFAIITGDTTVRLYNNGDYVIDDHEHMLSKKNSLSNSLSLAVQYLNAYFTLANLK